TSISFPVGSVLKLSFRLARSGVSIATRCEVRHSLPGAGLGVEFIDLPPECARAIETEFGMAARANLQSATGKSRRRASKSQAR
ncbi:MAG: PilZ domain-containing protein, partial [Terriglobales bacterium]